MKIFKILLLLLIIASLSWSPSQAKKDWSGPRFGLPEHAEGKSIVYLGEATDPGTMEVVEGYAIIKRVDGHGKPDGVGGGKNKPKASACYEYMAKGAKWKTLEPWVVNPSNIDGLVDSKVFDVMDEGVNKWEDAAEKEILGAGSLTNLPLEADLVSPDDENEVYFASIDDPGVIGVTVVWGIFGGRPSGRKLVEWDQIYDDVDFDWGVDGDPNDMDFDSIATHELGHTVGLVDLYINECIEETMYGYASEGEINKRDLGPGDVDGVWSLYK
ncbi:matrixin family metalloprotease [Patescibacteria group bacterium]